ncbi:MAG TPA: LacI family DNA-binding transcriptional regulator [Chloroflexia bacterium]|nr:LacI family DNA-binding transcriptional regulator [Chloroflexia bacterium]
MRPKSITIKDIAEQAGVSVSTVSYVLNGNDKRVSLATREKVLELIQELNYRPNTMARGMVKRSTSTIGVIISDVDNSIFYSVIRGVEEILRASNYHLLLFVAATPQEEIQAIETLRSLQVDGIVFLSTTGQYQNEHLFALRDEKFPFVVINRNMGEAEVNLVKLDGVSMGKLATRHLLQLGHQKIATIAGPIASQATLVSALERHQGWREALQEHNIIPLPSWVISCNYSYRSGYGAIRRLLNQTGRGPNRPTAIFIANDTMAIGALCALQELHIRVPDDIAIVGVGDPPHAAYTAPPLTVVSMPMVEAGQVATRILLEQLNSPGDVQPKQVSLAGTLQIRVSCGAKP